MSIVRLRPRARRELAQIIAYLIENASPEVALRFRSAADETFQQLTRFPNSGAPRKVRGPRYTGVRMCSVKDFPSYLVFYFPRQGGIAVERVIHAKQDYRRMLR